jgi:RNA polymerase sigma-70 factor (ECF subfamily)
LDAISAMPQRERLESHYLLHAVLGKLHWRLNQHRAAAGTFRRALHLAQVGPEQNYLTRMIERAEGAEAAG